MKNSDLLKHVKGESIFLDDMPVTAGTLFATIFASPYAHGKIKMLELSEAINFPGVVDILTAKDIPGKNQIGNIIADESLLAEDEVEYIGEPIAIIISDTEHTGRKARELIKLEIEELPVILDPRDAYEKGSLITPPVTFSSGNVKKYLKESEIIVEGRVDIGGQEHLYLETQGSVAIPVEGGGVKIFSSTQAPTAVQKQASKVLGIPMNKIEVDVLRLGGAFGGKEDQATSWAVMTALAAAKLNRPVKLILHRKDDLKMTGKRHPYSADYKMGLSKEGKILSYDVTFYQNAGACADLSTAILERSLFHAANSYFIPNVKATGISCKTNLPPNTAFRGFGGPQAMFVIESAISKAAEKLGVPAYKIQQKNLLSENDHFYFGQKAKNVNAKSCWKDAVKKFNLSDRIKEIENFNNKNKLFKKGFALMPVCFGISFTSSFLNQASALVHVYTDGSVSISTAAVEMGQGVNEKIRIVASKVFSLDVDKIKIETTNTTRVANTSPTAASSAADLNGNAVMIACNEILSRLKNQAAKILKKDDSKNIEIKNEEIFYNGRKTKLNWNELVQQSYLNRVSLSSQAYYATPDIYFDRKKNKGNPFAYHVYGTAIITAKLDCIRGIYEIESAEIVHDFGNSISTKIDIGQVEGGLVQGIGWMTMEELVQNEKGELLSNSLSTYKIPDIYSIPNNIKIEFLENSKNSYGPFNSKAIGEPPFMYGIGAYFAIRNAMKAFNNKKEIQYNSPLTPEKVLMNLYEPVKSKQEKVKV